MATEPIHPSRASHPQIQSKHLLSNVCIFGSLELFCYIRCLEILYDQAAIFGSHSKWVALVLVPFNKDSIGSSHSGRFASSICEIEGFQ